MLLVFWLKEYSKHKKLVILGQIIIEKFIVEKNIKYLYSDFEFEWFITLVFYDKIVLQESKLLCTEILI